MILVIVRGLPSQHFFQFNVVTVTGIETGLNTKQNRLNNDKKKNYPNDHHHQYHQQQQEHQQRQQQLKGITIKTTNYSAIHISIEPRENLLG